MIIKIPALSTVLGDGCPLFCDTSQIAAITTALVDNCPSFCDIGAGMLLTRMPSRGDMAAMSDLGEDHFRYVPTRQRDVDWGLYVTGAGYMSCPAEYASYPVTPHPTAYDFPWSTGRKLPEYQAVYITRGRGEFESTPTGPVEIGEGTVFLFFPDVWHRCRPSTETGWDEYWVSFAGDAMDRLVQEGFFSAEHAVHAPCVGPAILTPYR